MKKIRVFFGVVVLAIGAYAATAVPCSISMPCPNSSEVVSCASTSGPCTAHMFYVQCGNKIVGCS